MRIRRVTEIPGALLLAGPTVLAFFSGGYFAVARTAAGVVLAVLAISLFVLAAVRPIPRTPDGASNRPIVIIVAALAAFAAWTVASVGWAPIAGRAYAAGQLAVLYALALPAAYLTLRRSPWLRRALEPALALGTLVVCGYGLLGRMLPGIVAMANSPDANGRLEQPLTYWNAMGELAAIGLVMCARLAGDRSRSLALRAAGAAAGVPLGLALYVSFSRGALYAAVAGLLALTVLVPTRAALRATVITVGSAALAVGASAGLSGFTSLTGTLARRETQGLEALAATLVIMLMAVSLLAWRDGTAEARLTLPRRAGWIVTGLIIVGLALAIVIGAHETSGVPLGGSASRLTTLQSNRFQYWHVALEAFAHDPVVGVGAGGWSVWWLQKRPYADGATDAHSLELQTLAELGLVGLALLAVFLAAAGRLAVSALRVDPVAAAGPVAGALVWLVHSPLDWDWQMPALSLVALLLAAGFMATAVSGEMPAHEAGTGRLRGRPRAIAFGGLCLTVLIGAWFLLGLRQARDQQDAERILAGTHPIPARTADHAEALLRRAGQLSPDRQVDLDRAALLVDRAATPDQHRRNSQQAQSIIREVTAAEPDNVAAWLALAETAPHQEALFAHALAEVSRLEPRLP